MLNLTNIPPEPTEEQILWFEALNKSINDLGLLDNIETEYFYINQYKRLMTGKTSKFLNKHKISLSKTLTLEEAIEFLKIYEIKNYNSVLFLDLNKIGFMFNDCSIIIFFEGKTLLEAIEKMLEYLLDNNLLGKQ